MDPYYLETKKFSSQLFGARKKRLTAISRQKNCFAAICGEKKVDPCYLKTQKYFSKIFGARKNSMTVISNPRKTVLQLYIWREKRWNPAIWSPKNVFHNSLEQGKGG